MADNATYYGFRWSTAHNGRPCPQPERYRVSSGETFAVGASAKKLGPGDLVRLKSDGTVEQCDGTEGGGGTEVPYGVVIGIERVYDSTLGQSGNMAPKNFIDSGATYPSREMANYVLAVPVSMGTWEVEADDNTTATTEAAYEAMIGENVDHILEGGDGRLSPRLDVSTRGTGNTLMWRVVGISTNLRNQDFSGANVALLVRANRSQESWSSPTGT